MVPNETRTRFESKKPKKAFVLVYISIRQTIYSMCISFNEMINKCVYKWSLYRFLCRRLTMFSFRSMCFTSSSMVYQIVLYLQWNQKHKTVVNYIEISSCGRYTHSIYIEHWTEIFARIFLAIYCVCWKFCVFYGFCTIIRLAVNTTISFSWEKIAANPRPTCNRQSATIIQWYLFLISIYCHWIIL